MAIRRRARVAVRRAGGRRARARRNPPKWYTESAPARSLKVVGYLGTGPYEQTIKIPYDDADDGKAYVHELGEAGSKGAADIGIHLVEVELYGKCILLSHIDGKPLWRRS